MSLFFSEIAEVLCLLPLTFNNKLDMFIQLGDEVSHIILYVTIASADVEAVFSHWRTMIWPMLLYTSKSLNLRLSFMFLSLLLTCSYLYSCCGRSVKFDKTVLNCRVSDVSCVELALPRNVLCALFRFRCNGNSLLLFASNLVEAVIGCPTSTLFANS